MKVIDLERYKRRNDTRRVFSRANHPVKTTSCLNATFPHTCT